MNKLTNYKFTTVLHNGEPPKGYFFASSIGEWKTGYDLDAILKRMKSGRLSFNLFWVPVPEDSEYRISGYAPQVPGAVWLGCYELV